jgi:hypothetical protein
MDIKDELGRTWLTKEGINQDSHSLGWESNPRSPQYEAGIANYLTTTSGALVSIWPNLPYAFKYAKEMTVTNWAWPTADFVRPTSSNWTPIQSPEHEKFLANIYIFPLLSQAVKCFTLNLLEEILPQKCLNCCWQWLISSTILGTRIKIYPQHVTPCALYGIH